MGAAIVFGLLGLIVVASAGPGTWSQTFPSPFAHSTYYVASNGTGNGGSATSYYTQSTWYTPANSTGGFAALMKANSTHLVSTSIGYNASMTTVSAHILVHVNVPFKNFSGTRTLSQVTLNFSYSAQASFTANVGHCPWVKALHKTRNICQISGGISAGVGPLDMSYLKGGHVTWGTCVAPCGGWPALGGSEAIVNTSSGATYKNYGLANGSTLTSGYESLTFVPTIPLKASGTLVIRFDATGELTCYIESLTGHGGYVGASISGTLRYTMTLNSVVES